MANNLIQNETKVFYTVSVNDGLFVKYYEMRHGKVEGVSVTDKEKYADTFNNQETAVKVATFVKGTAIKHTRTTVVTEVTEEVGE